MVRVQLGQEVRVDRRQQRRHEILLEQGLVLRTRVVRTNVLEELEGREKTVGALTHICVDLTPVLGPQVLRWLDHSNRRGHERAHFFGVLV